MDKQFLHSGHLVSSEIKMSENPYFIQDAIKNRGGLRNFIARKYGRKGFILHKGRPVIRPDIIKAIAKGKIKVSPLERRRAILAQTLIRIGKRRYKV